MALNSLLIDPNREYDGEWRWFDEDMLNCCKPSDIIKIKAGITLAKVNILLYKLITKIYFYYKIGSLFSEVLWSKFNIILL